VIDRYLDDAIEVLFPLVSDWVHYPHQGKQELMDAWRGLTAQQKAALDADVLRAVLKNHRSDVFFAWRRKGLPHGKLGGASLHTIEPPSSTQPEAFLIHASDVMIHWGQEELPLARKSFAHEKEIILKPDVKESRAR
jgi:hypothetical protein